MITFSAPISETVWIPADAEIDQIQLLTLSCAVIATAVGTVRLTLRWIDPLAGAQVRNYDAVLVGTGFKYETVLPMVQAAGSDLTYQISHLSVIGTPNYSVNIAQNG